MTSNLSPQRDGNYESLGGGGVTPGFGLVQPQTGPERQCSVSGYYYAPLVITLAAGETITLADGQTFTLADGQEVTLAAGQTFNLAEGQEVTLAEGQEVTLAAGQVFSLDTGQEVTLAAGQTFSLAPGQEVSLASGQKATYRAAIAGLVAVTGCTDLFTLTGSDTKVVKITHVELNGTEATAPQFIDVLGIVRSTANLTGTDTQPAAVPLDSADAAATAVVRAYTANPGTLGTTVGTIEAESVYLPLADTPTIPPYRLSWDFGSRPGAKAVVLHGAAEVFALNLAAVAIPNATSISVSIEWTEEDSPLA